MSDEPPLETPEQLHSELPAVAPGPALQSPRRNLVPWFYGIGFLVLAGAVFYLWQYPSVPVQTAADVSDTHAADQKLASLEARLSLLEQQPKAPPPPDLSKITAQLDALGTRVSDQTQLASRLDVLSGRIESMSGVSQTGIDAIKQELDREAGRLSAVEKTTGSLGAGSTKVDHVARIQEAALALANGQPLGDLPGAPAALSRYAHVAPPTVAHLRLTFPEMERAALSAGQSVTASGPFIDRVWERTQSLVTVRQGEDVIVGNTSAVTLTRAKIALEAGDLGAAVNSIALLSPNALHAATDWLADAKALMDARSALIDMAAHS